MKGSQVVHPLEGSEDLNQHLDRLLNSERFRNSPSLRHLLEYLVGKLANGDIEHIKESVVAIEVFGRPADFDSRIDNIVRVHAHRLRKALETYYVEEGAAEKLRFSIPKGSYLPLVQRVDEPVAIDGLTEDLPEPISLPKPTAPKRGINSVVWLVLGSFLAGGLMMFGVLDGTGHVLSRTPRSRLDSLQKPPLAALWSSLLLPGINCVVSYTNPVFLWTEAPKNRIYMTYHGPISAPLGTQLNLSPGDPYVDPDLVRKTGPYFFSDSWTGTGEVIAVHKLTELFSEAGVSLKVIRSRALSYADMKGSNVIFLGSPWANDMQEKFNIGATPLICVGNEKILNRDPKQGEAASYYSIFEPGTKQLVASYGLFSVLPGVSPGTKIISSAGINTYATFATIDFMTSAAGVKELMHRLIGEKPTPPDYFQAVVRTEIIKGDTANSTLVLARPVNIDRSSK